MTLIPWVLKGMRYEYNKTPSRFPFEDNEDQCVAGTTATYCPTFGIVCHFYAIGEGNVTLCIG